MWVEWEYLNLHQDIVNEFLVILPFFLPCSCSFFWLVWLSTEQKFTLVSTRLAVCSSGELGALRSSQICEIWICFVRSSFFRMKSFFFMSFVVFSFSRRNSLCRLSRWRGRFFSILSGLESAFYIFIFFILFWSSFSPPPKLLSSLYSFRRNINLKIKKKSKQLKIFQWISWVSFSSLEFNQQQLSWRYQVSVPSVHAAKLLNLFLIPVNKISKIHFHIRKFSTA